MAIERKIVLIVGIWLVIIGLIISMLSKHKRVEIGLAILGGLLMTAAIAGM